MQSCEDALGQLIDRLRQMNDDADGFHLVEHILLRPVNVQWAFYLTGSISRLFKSATNYTNREDGKRKFMKDLLEFGGTAKNYSVTKKGEKKFVLQLKGEKGRVIAENSSFILKKSAEEAGKEALAFLKKIPTGKTATLAKSIDVEQLLSKQGRSLASDPYSLQMSLIMPNWSGRFQSDKMKMLFENIVRVNSPAHLHLWFRWWNVEKMAEFEKSYQTWMEEKSNEKPSFDKIDTHSRKILSLLTE